MLVSCQQADLYMEQNPARTVVDYTPGSYTMDGITGTVTPDADYTSWLSYTQSGSSVSFTVRRNTTGLIRRAEFTVAGSTEKMVINQKAHSLDAGFTPEISNQGATEVTVASTLSTKYFDDYESWGLIYGTTSDVNAGTMLPQNSPLANGKNTGTITGLKEGVDYYIWPYVVSTEGDVVKGSMVAMIAPVFVRTSCSLQDVIDNAKEYQEIRVLGGLTFSGGINIFDSNKNKAISGGWNEDFTEQSMDNLTKIAGGGSVGFNCQADATDLPLQGYFKVSYFDISGCKGNHGAGIHICGGPLTVHHCYFHDNDGEKGAAIGTREEKYSSEEYIYNNIFEANTADGHGAVLGLGDGVSTSDFVKATVVSNLFINNRSESFGGYASIFICYNYTELNFINNTVVGNFNYYDGDDPYSGMMFRGNTRNIVANNIIVGNLISKDKLRPAVEEPHPNYTNFGGSHAVFVNNVYEGGYKESSNVTFADNIEIAAGASYSAYLSNDYQPLGKAIGAGTLSTFAPTFNDGTSNPTSVKDILEKYPYDLAGNPRVVNGKVDLGCYQTK